MPEMKTREMLANTGLFRDLAPEVIERIAGLASTRSLSGGQILFSKGDPGDALYGVLKGEIRISAGSPGGKEVILNAIRAGEFFGEIALLDGQPRTADATAVIDCDLVRIARADFIRYMESEPRLSTHLLELLCHRVRATSEMVEDSAFLSLPARLAKRLLALAGEAADEISPIDLRVSQHQLGQLMDSSREAINRNLQAWRRRGWVELSRNRVTILNAEALRDIVEEDLDA
jgi:CRP-like cAMP-binding protein